MRKRILRSVRENAQRLEILAMAVEMKGYRRKLYNCSNDSGKNFAIT
jgi:hypothetical protein